MPTNYPIWASWDSKEVYLPPAFHTSRNFGKCLSILKDSFKDSSTFEDGGIDAPLLLLGLVFKEVSRAMEVERGEEEASGYPPHLVNSPLGIKQMKKLEAMVEALALPSEK